MRDTKSILDDLFTCVENKCVHCIYFYIDRNSVMSLLTDYDSTWTKEDQQKLDNYLEWLKIYCENCSCNHNPIK